MEHFQILGPFISECTFSMPMISGWNFVEPRRTKCIRNYGGDGVGGLGGNVLE